MGTSLGDSTHYMSGLAHTAPPVPPRQQRWLDLRWKEWEPMLVLRARRESLDPAHMLHQFRRLHQSRMVRLLSSGIRLGIIKKHRLDDPTNGENRFQFLLDAAVVRRRSRMGRVKGIRHGEGSKRRIADASKP